MAALKNSHSQISKTVGPGCVCIAKTFSGQHPKMMIKAKKEISKYIKHSQLDIASDQEILSSWTRMETRANSCSKAQMKTWSQAAGIDWSAQALLASAILKKQNILRPISQYMHDFMHGLASNGVLTWITFLLIQSLYDSGEVDIWKKLHGFFTLWVHPKKGKVAVHRLFDNKAVESHKKASKFKCSASEMLGVCEIMAYYVELCCIPHGLCIAACRCFLDWCKVLNYCVAIPSLQRPCHKHLLELVEAALASTISAGWSEEFRPKFHWAMHFSDALKLHGQLPGVWSLERKHKDIRKHANLLCNTSSYEKSLLASVIAEHMHSLETHVESFREGCFLENVRQPTKKMMAALQSSGLLFLDSACMCSSSCRLASGATITSGDVIYLQSASTLLLAIFLWGGCLCGEVHGWRQGIVHIGVKVECAHSEALDICVFGRNPLFSDIFKCQRQSHLSHPTIFVGQSVKNINFFVHFMR